MIKIYLSKIYIIFVKHEKKHSHRRRRLLFNSDGYRCFTEQYHLKRGYCCESGCKHCPYGYNTTYKYTKIKQMNAINITFEDEILEGIPNTLPPSQPYDDSL